MLAGGAVNCASVHVGEIRPGTVRGNHRHHDCNETFIIWGARTAFRVCFIVRFLFFSGIGCEETWNSWHQLIEIANEYEQEMFISFLENLRIKIVSEIMGKITMYDVEMCVKNKTIVAIAAFVFGKIEKAMPSLLPIKMLSLCQN